MLTGRAVPPCVFLRLQMWNFQEQYEDMKDLKDPLDMKAADEGAGKKKRGRR